LPYLADLETSGIPTVLLTYTEETEKVNHDSVLWGVPKLRIVEADRKSPGGVDEANKVMQPLLDGLTRRLTEEEKESGRWAPQEPRILFEGTLDEAQEFYQQTENLPGILGAPFSKYTDGLPIIIPTEERVAEMLKGTHHKPDDLITLQHDVEEAAGMSRMPKKTGKFMPLGRTMVFKKGEAVRFMPMGRVATVEQVAVNAVMAGCKPEYFPVVLAIAESDPGSGGGGRGGGAYIVSGPIYNEIGMNVSYGMFDPCNPANMTLGRVGNLLWRNLGGYKESVTTVTTGLGNAVTSRGFIFAECAEKLPASWQGLNEEMGFRKDESIVMSVRPTRWGLGQEHQPGIYRSLQRTGHGAMARYLDVKGVVGPHNYLEFLTKGIWACREGGFTLVMVPQMAQDLCDYGFKSKDEIYEWIWKRSFEPLKEYRMRGTTDENTNGWLGIERTSGKHWKELSDDYMVPAGGHGPWAYCILVADCQETASLRFSGGHGQAYSIDAWR
jgi:hypothetical protein